jgi:hypothetical protein
VYIVTVVKSMRMREAGHVARIKNRNAYGVLVGRPVERITWKT